MELSILTFSMLAEAFVGKLNADKLFAVVSENGIKHVDLLEYEVSKYGKGKIKAAGAKYGVGVSCYVAYVPFLPKNAGKVKVKIESAVNTAKELGAKVLMVVPFLTSELKAARGLPRKEVRDMIADVLTLCVKAADGSGLSVCFEDTPRIDLPASSTEDCKYILDKVKGLGLVFDTANTLHGGSDPWEFYDALKDHITYVHLKDVAYTDSMLGDRITGGKKIIAVVYGRGFIDVKGFVNKLEEDGYKGPAAIEYVRPNKMFCKFSDHAEQIAIFCKYLAE
jgi:sugar phosphate isomerase/epimerase